MLCVEFVQGSDCEGRMNKVQPSDKDSDQLTRTFWDIEIDAHLWLGWRRVFPLPVQHSPPCFFCLFVRKRMGNVREYELSDLTDHFGGSSTSIEVWGVPW